MTKEELKEKYIRELKDNMNCIDYLAALFLLDKAIDEAYTLGKQDKFDKMNDEIDRLMASETSLFKQLMSIKKELEKVCVLDRDELEELNEDEFLEEIEEYLDRRQDADHDGNGYVANEEMKLLIKLKNYKKNIRRHFGTKKLDKGKLETRIKQVAIVRSVPKKGEFVMVYLKELLEAITNIKE